jgi:hypothetical protein
MQQEELRKTNEELQEKAELLAQQEVGGRSQEPRGRRGPARRWREKAEQLALTSKYKSEFLANMSHELPHAAQFDAHPFAPIGRKRRNQSTGKQVQFADTIHSPATTCFR